MCHVWKGDAIRIVYSDLFAILLAFVLFSASSGWYGFDTLLAPIGIVVGFSLGSAFALWQLGMIDRWGEINRQVARRAVREPRTRIIYTTLFFVFLGLFVYVISLGEKEASIIWVSSVFPLVLSALSGHLFWFLRWERKNNRKIVTKSILSTRAYTISKSAQPND